MELSNSMDPTQKAGNQLKEVKGAAGNRNADELVLVGYYTGAPAGITAELLGLRPRAHWPKYSYYWKRCLLFGTCEECVGEPRLRYFSPAIGPTTILKDEQLRLDAAAMVVGSSWSWASLQSGLEHDVPEFMIARRKAAQAQAYALPRSHLMHGTEEVWRQLEAWFLE